MKFEWKKVLVDGKQMVELMSVRGIAEEHDLPNAYINYSANFGCDVRMDRAYGSDEIGFWIHSDDNSIPNRVLGTHVPGARFTCEGYKVLMGLVDRCAANLKRIDIEIAAKEKENAGWEGTFVNEV